MDMDIEDAFECNRNNSRGSYGNNILHAKCSSDKSRVI